MLHVPCPGSVCHERRSMAARGLRRASYAGMAARHARAHVCLSAGGRSSIGAVGGEALLNWCEASVAWC